MIYMRLLARIVGRGLAGALLLGLAVYTPAGAQVAGGAIQGLVSDSSGAVLAAAQVTVTGVATGVSRSASTNSTGFYSIADLQPAVYKVTVSAPGFSSDSVENVVLTVGADLTINFKLAVGSSTQQVEVRGTTASVDLATSQIDAVVDSSTMRELPLNGRDHHRG